MRMNNKAVLEVRDLRVERGGSILLDIPLLDVKEGEILSLIGPNGAGKTTLLQTLCCLVRPSRGAILFRGVNLGSELPVSEYRRMVTMVFQEPLLFNTTVASNVASGLKLRKAGRRDTESIVNENLERFGIGHLWDRSARTLSGGEAQRTALARAFAVRPAVLLLDEPFAALDAPTRDILIEDLDRVIRQSGTTAVFATHDRTEAIRLSDRMGVMNGGGVVQIGPPEEVMNYPVDEFVASFVGMETVLRGKVVRQEEGTFICSVYGHDIEAVGTASPGNTVVICVRPEHVTLTVDSGHIHTSARNVFHGRVERITPFGLYQKVRVDCGFPLIAYVTNHSVRELRLSEGTAVDASFKATAIHVLTPTHRSAVEVTGGS